MTTVEAPDIPSSCAPVDPRVLDDVNRLLGFRPDRRGGIGSRGLWAATQPHLPEPTPKPHGWPPGHPRSAVACVVSCYGRGGRSIPFVVIAQWVHRTDESFPGVSGRWEITGVQAARVAP